MAKRSKQTLTQRKVEALLKTPGWYPDYDMPGFILKVNADREGYFGVRYTVRGTTIRRFKGLGKYGTVTLTDAREAARVYLSAAALGGDPVGDREAVPTWETWTDRYFARLETKTKATFHAYYLGLTPELSKQGKPTDPTFRQVRSKWGSLPLTAITPEHLEAERQALREKGESTANRWAAVIAGAFAAAQRGGLIPKSPAAGVRKLREAPPKSRTLAPEETGRLLAALALEGDRHAVAAVLLALLAGARRAEALGLKWDNVDLEAGVAVLPDSKSGKRRYLPLVPFLVDYLKRLPHSGPFVVASESEKKPRPDVKGPWKRLTEAASLKDITFHDLRRTWGLAINRAGGLRVAQEGLGHSSPDVTASTYTPEGFDSVKAAAAKAAEALGLVN